MQTGIDKIRSIGIKIRLFRDDRLSGNLRIEQLEPGVETIFLKQSGVIGHPNRRESAARLSVGHDHIGLLRFATDFRGQRIRGRQTHQAGKPN